MITDPVAYVGNCGHGNQSMGHRSVGQGPDRSDARVLWPFTSTRQRRCCSAVRAVLGMLVTARAHAPTEQAADTGVDPGLTILTG